MQKQFSQALFDPTLLPPTDIRVRPGSDPLRRFNVYRNNVMVALIEALEDSYPVVQALVGNEFFRAMAREFARSQPPSSPIMAHYGDRFPDFIAGFAAAATLPYLADVARLEWLRVRAWHAEDCTPLGAADIAPLSADPAASSASCWQFSTAVALLASPFAIVSLWSAHQADTDAEVETRLADIVIEQPEAALILRQDQVVLVLPLTPAEAAFVEAVMAGEPLALAVAAAQQLAPEFDLALIFAMLLQSGALIGFQAQISAGD